jgi:hypothetical protein
MRRTKASTRRSRTASAIILSALALAACAQGTASGPATSPRAAAGGSASSGASGPVSLPAASGSSPAGSTASGGFSPGAAPADGDWPTYHRTDDRAGAAPDVPAPHRLTRAWTAQLDGAVYGQPLVLGDQVVVATENDSVYGLALAAGSVRWHTSVGTPVPLSELPCGNIDPLGITGTPAYDASTGSVFVVAELNGGHHDLVALDARSGAVRWRRTLDVTNRNYRAEQERGALAVANGRVYVPFGGLAGDCSNYVGYVTGTPVSGSGDTVRYEVPTAREGGIWAPSGVAIDAGGDAWVAVGNGASTGVPYDGSDSVLRLAPDLSRRLDFFAPTNWGSENAEDADLGSTGPLLLDRGRVLISGKTADVYLLAAGRLGGIGGQVADVGGCSGFGGMAWDAAQQAAFVPCTDGLLRVDVGDRTLTARGRAAAAVTGSPVIGGGAVFSLDPHGTAVALDERTGARLASAPVGPTSRFASPVLSGNRVLVPTLSGVVALSIG